MPRIDITLNDNTGAEYTSDEQVVFVPGSVRIKDGQADDNNCVYIAAADASKVSDIFDFDTSELGGDVKAQKEIKEAAEAELEAAEKNLATKKAAHEAAGKNYTKNEPNKDNLAEGEWDKITKALGEAEYAHTKAEERVQVAKEKLKSIEYVAEKANCLAMIDTYLAAGLDVLYCYLVPDADGSPAKVTYNKIKFLLDKDSYNVKWLTAGAKETISTEVAADDNSNASITFDFDVQNDLMTLAAERMDCVALASVEYDTEALAKIGLTKGDSLAQCVKKALTLVAGSTEVVNVEEASIDVKVSNGMTKTSSEFGYLLFPNLKDALVSKIAGTRTFTIPGSLAYLVAAGRCLRNNQDWLSVANTARGTVSYTPDIKVTKYCMDSSPIIEDDQGISFNGIVTVRPSTKVIWGDRTLKLNDQSVKASSYMSLMLLICDISKRAYNAAVKCTYESNNEVTWLNYKSRIVELLDEAVASGVLQTYDVSKGKADTYNTIVCKIKIYPNLPVENFDIIIDVENAELTVENA